MKCVLFVIMANLFLIQGAPSSDPYKSDMKRREQMGLECLKEINIGREVIEKAVHTLQFPKDNQKYKDFLACSYKKQGFQNEDGKMMFSNVKDFLMRYYSAADLKGLDFCQGVVGDNDGEIAFNALQCIIDQLKKIEEQNENTV